jgi:hypothetical protein
VRLGTLFPALHSPVSGKGFEQNKSKPPAPPLWDSSIVKPRNSKPCFAIFSKSVPACQLFLPVSVSILRSPKVEIVLIQDKF